MVCSIQWPVDIGRLDPRFNNQSILQPIQFTLAGKTFFPADVCNKPYEELIALIRDIGYKLYNIRSGK